MDDYLTKKMLALFLRMLNLITTFCFIFLPCIFHIRQNIGYLIYKLKCTAIQCVINIVWIKQTFIELYLFRMMYMAQFLIAKACDPMCVKKYDFRWKMYWCHHLLRYVSSVLKFMQQQLRNELKTRFIIPRICLNTSKIYQACNRGLSISKTLVEAQWNGTWRPGFKII